MAYFSKASGAVAMSLVLAGACPAQLVVTEVMYDPASDETRWEWIEVHNRGSAAVDLDGFVIDRVGDRERTTVTANIQSRPLVGAEAVFNATVIPAGGIAILYNGPGLGYSPSRFRAAWPGLTPGATLVGVEGWSSNALTNSPSATEYAPSLPALTVGLWPDEASYRLDAADFGQPGSPDRRVHRTTNAAAAFGYDNDSPWPDAMGRASILYRGGAVFSPTSWGRSNYPFGGVTESRATFVPVPLSAPDYGSPGVAPPGAPDGAGLYFTEALYDPASPIGAQNEWEWIEVLNTGPAIDFAQSPAWLDDDDGDPLAAANVTAGRIATGATAVLFNASAATLSQMRSAWDRPGQPPINWIGVDPWPQLANTGDLVGLWRNAAAYNADQGGTAVTLTRASAGLTYDDSAPWPTGVEGDAIRLTHLSSDPADPAAWARARGAQADLDAWQAATIVTPGGAVDNVGGEQGSPGFVWPDVRPPLPGDYNRDGSVDAADYTLWRDGAPLPTETATAGVTDAADHEVWRAAYSPISPIVGVSTAGGVAIPEPLAAALVASGAIAGLPLYRVRRDGVL